MPKQNRRSGLTILELLVATAVVGILSTMAVLNYYDTLNRSKDARRIEDIKSYSTTIELRNSVKKTALVVGAGIGGKGWGNILIAENGVSKSIAESLQDEGYLKEIAFNPATEDGTTDLTFSGYDSYFLTVCDSSWRLLKPGNAVEADADKDKSVHYAIYTTLYCPEAQMSESTQYACGGPKSARPTGSGSEDDPNIIHLADLE